ncbi:MAG TPA: urea transporter, partial [Candidatus Obscuribacterales bacterium]
LLSLIVRMNGVLTVCVLGGLYAVPGWRSAIVALTGGFISCIMALALAKVFSLSGLPVLALPFVLACYLVFLGLSPNRGGNWLRFWLPEPTLPEQSLEQMRQASARGVDVTSVALRAPFSGTWQVWQGFFGEYTHKVPWQYALDFIQTSSGSSYKGLGSSVTDYHCYGKPILSPAYGRVVDLRYDVLDNAPGEVNTAENWGNYIIILLDCGLYVLLAHLQKDSVKVAVDSRVVPGQLLAFAGNSGRSPQPHLHMHVQEGILPGTRTVPFHLTGVIENSHDFTNYTLRSCPKERALITAPNRNAALKKALHLNVGNHLQFEVAKTNHKTASATFSVTMDLAGHYALESKSGARVSFCTTDDVVAFYDRTGPDDDVLDAVILSIGLTPLTEGSITWTDQVPRRLLPMPVATRVLSTIIKPFSTCEQSVYERKWDPILQIWTQIGKHTVSGLGPFNWTCLTEAHLCEATGLVKFKLIANGETTIEAALAAYGVPDDNEGPDITAAEPASA